MRSLITTYRCAPDNVQPPGTARRPSTDDIALLVRWLQRKLARGDAAVVLSPTSARVLLDAIRGREERVA